MASWAGGYGAGGAAQGLQQLLENRILVAKQAEVERSQRAQEAQQQAELAQRSEQFRQAQGVRFAELAAGQDENYQNRTQHVSDRNQLMQRQTTEDQIRAKELADKSLDETVRTKNEQDYRTSERKGHESFEAMMARRAAGSGGGASEPLVAIKDPNTGQPVLVPRSQAAGRAPASTRDQAMTEGQGNAATFADRMTFNERHLRNFDKQATGRGAQLQGWLPGELQSSELQSYEAAKRNWMAANLRRQSGAAISQSEYDEMNRQYFPQPGDDPKLVQQKRELRAIDEAGMRRSAGHGGGGAGAPADAPPAAPAGDDLGADF